MFKERIKKPPPRGESDSESEIFLNISSKDPCCLSSVARESPTSDSDLDIESLHINPRLPISPTPGFCVKSKILNGVQVFINFCHCKEVKKPKDGAFPFKTNVKGNRKLFSFPLSLGQPHPETDKAGKVCVCFDVIVNSEFFESVKDNPEICGYVLALSIDGIKQKYGVIISKTDCFLFDEKYYGRMPEHHIATIPSHSFSNVICLDAKSTASKNLKRQPFLLQVLDWEEKSRVLREAADQLKVRKKRRKRRKKRSKDSEGKDDPILSTSVNDSKLIMWPPSMQVDESKPITSAPSAQVDKSKPITSAKMSALSTEVDKSKPITSIPMFASTKVNESKPMNSTLTSQNCATPKKRRKKSKSKNSGSANELSDSKTQLNISLESNLFDQSLSKLNSGNEISVDTKAELNTIISKTQYNISLEAKLLDHELPDLNSKNEICLDVTAELDTGTSKTQYNISLEATLDYEFPKLNSGNGVSFNRKKDLKSKTSSTRSLKYNYLEEGSINGISYRLSLDNNIKCFIFELTALRKFTNRCKPKVNVSRHRLVVNVTNLNYHADIDLPKAVAPKQSKANYNQNCLIIAMPLLSTV